MRKPAARPSDDASRGDAQAPVRVDVADLVGTAREVVLVHDGQEYKLRITAKGKLILTK